MHASGGAGLARRITDLRAELHAVDRPHTTPSPLLRRPPSTPPRSRVPLVGRCPSRGSRENPMAVLAVGGLPYAFQRRWLNLSDAASRIV